MTAYDEISCFIEGFKAFENGILKTQCPHESRTDEFYQWNKGWDKALRHSLKSYTN